MAQRCGSGLLLLVFEASFCDQSAVKGRFLLVVVFMFAADSILRHLTHATERIARKIRRKRQDLPRHFGKKG